IQTLSRSIPSLDAAYSIISTASDESGATRLGKRDPARLRASSWTGNAVRQGFLSHKKVQKSFCAFLWLFFFPVALSTQAPVTTKNTNVLWYRQPAASWTEALPIGNGRLGAMIFGSVGSERIQLNEDTIWAGERRDRNNPEGAKNLAEVRRLLFAGKPKEAEELAEKTIIAIPKRMPPYQPLGDFLIRFSGQPEASEYRRELDLDSGIVPITY